MRRLRHKLRRKRMEWQEQDGLKPCKHRHLEFFKDSLLNALCVRASCHVVRPDMGGVGRVSRKAYVDAPYSVPYNVFYRTSSEPCHGLRSMAAILEEETGYDPLGRGRRGDDNSGAGPSEDGGGPTTRRTVRREAVEPEEEKWVAQDTCTEAGGFTARLEGLFGRGHSYESSLLCSTERTDVSLMSRDGTIF